MGVIQRQSIKYSIVNLAGLAIGTLSTLFIYPRVLEANGTMRFLLDTGVVFLPLLALGANALTNRFFPKFENKKEKHHGFLPLILGLTLVGLLFFGTLALVFWEKIENYYLQKSPRLAEFLPFIAPVAFFYVFNQVLFNYSANFKRIVVPTILIDFSQKIVLPILLFSVWQDWFSLRTACWFLVAHGSLVFFGLIIYLKKIGAWQWGNFQNFITPDLKKEMLRYAAFGTFAGLALLVAAKVDTLMVGTFKDALNLGVFAIALQIAAVIEIPTKGIYSASTSTVAKHLHDENFGELGKLYRQVSINLLAVGLLLFFSIWISFENLLLVLPNGERLADARWVFFFIGLARLLEMATGLNNNIIYYSKYYAWSLASLGLTAVLTIFLNLWLIPKIGITGAAVATCFSVFFYNFLTLVLVWAKFKLQPFSAKTLLAVGGAVGIYLIFSNLQKTGSAWLDIFLGSGFFAVFYVFFVLKMKISPEANAVVLKFFAKK